MASFYIVACKIWGFKEAFIDETSSNSVLNAITKMVLSVLIKSASR